MAWVPPHPDSGNEWEPVQDMRRRFNIEFIYTPTLIHPELCRHVTEEECQEVDESMQRHAQKQRELYIQINPEIGKYKVSKPQ